MFVRISVPNPSFRRIFDSPRNDMLAVPTDLTRKVMVDISPFEVLIPGEGIPPWKCSSPVVLLKLGGAVQIPMIDFPTDGETTCSLSEGNFNLASIVFIVCCPVSRNTET